MQRQLSRHQILVKAAFKFSYNLLLVGFAAVKFKAEMRQTHLTEPFVNDLEGCHFVADEKHGFAVGDAFGDDVGYGLAFSRARRTLHNKALTAQSIFDGDALAAVCVENLIGFLGSLNFVNVFLVRQAV